MVYLFVFLCWLHKKYVDLNNIKHNCLLLGIFIYFLAILSSVLFNFLGHYLSIDILLIHATYFNGYNSPFLFFAALETFIAFIKMKPYENKFINLISSTTLGIYLIHDNLFFRPFLWEKIFNNSSYYYSVYLIPYSIFVCLLVFCCSVIVDLIRQKTIEKMFLPLIYRVFDYIHKMFLKDINSNIYKQATK